ncbi:MAG: hypothetical protein [Caudoviricetes sp.]|nr:MAG: hypothetical protein [Caudoviricetes sp.]
MKIFKVGQHVYHKTRKEFYGKGRVVSIEDDDSVGVHFPDMGRKGHTAGGRVESKGWCCCPLELKLASPLQLENK